MPGSPPRSGDPTKVLERQTVEVRPPGLNEVRVKVSTFCVNFNDTDIVRGRWTTVPLEPPFVPGMDTMGVVESAGPNAEHLVGRRIVGIPAGAHGGFAEYAVVDATSAMLIPDWLSDTDATALHYPFHLSWFALVERAQLEPGETLLVHAGAGGVGSAAIQLGKALGARVIATAGGPEKVAFCKELGADEAIDYTDGGFADAVVDATFGAGRRRRPRHRRRLGHDRDLPVHGHARSDPAGRLRRGHHQRRRAAQPGPGDLRQLLAARRLPRLRRRPARHPHD